MSINNLSKSSNGRPRLSYEEALSGMLNRFNERRIIISENECWKWIGGKHHDGRGFISFRGKNITAPTVAYFIDKGEWPKPGFEVCHSCDNPECTNPKHLWIGTRLDNVRDAKAKKRLAGQSLTHCKRGHPLIEGNLVKNYPTRKCLACARLPRTEYFNSYRRKNKDKLNQYRRERRKLMRLQCAN